MLYTGKGDNGTTKLFGCAQRIGKDEPRLRALGNLDELNSWIGYCKALSSGLDGETQTTLHGMQEDLFVVQAILAGAPKTLSPERLISLERLISKIEDEIEPIRSFTISGANALSGALDVGRAIARRAERSVVSLDGEFRENIVPYLNRLSSALFALARLTAHRAGIAESPPTY